MKQFFTLIISGLMMMSTIGQNSGNSRHLLIDHMQHLRAAKPGSLNDKPAENGRIRPLTFSNQANLSHKNSLVLMQQMDSYVYQEYNSENSQWENASMNEFAYDAVGNNTSDIFYMWNQDNEIYDKTGKQEFSYDDGHLTERLYFEWDVVNNQWAQYLRWLHSYNGDGLMTMAYSYFWDGSGWEMAAKDQRTYDENGNLTVQLMAWWDESGSQWINDNKIENSYNADGSLDISIQFIWGLFSNEWENSYMDEYTYNDEGFITMYTTSFWNSVTEQWVYEFQNEFVYDENMNIVMSREYSWDGTEWVYGWRSELAYNNAYTFNQLILPWYFMDAAGNEFQHMLTEITEYGFDGIDFVPTTRSQFNYSQVNITGIEENITGGINIYPQPSNGQVSFRWANNNPTLELRIYDVNGKTVVSQQIENNGAVPVDRLAPGLYFYNLSKNDQTNLFSGKLSIR